MTIDEVKDIIANQIKEILKDIKIEPRLIPLLGETLYPRSAIHTDEACRVHGEDEEKALTILTK